MQTQLDEDICYVHTRCAHFSLLLSSESHFVYGNGLRHTCLDASKYVVVAIPPRLCAEEHLRDLLGLGGVFWYFELIAPSTCFLPSPASAT